MAAPSPTELELLRKFRSKLRDLNLDEYLNSDMELLRWIRARENDLGQAEIMLRKHMQWREDKNYEALGTWELPEPFEGLIKDEFLGFDRENCPIVISHLGKWDIKRVIHEGGSELFLNSRWKILAKMKDLMRSKLTPEGVPVTQGACILNMEGFSIRQASLQVLRTHAELAKMFEANFPEFLKVAIVYNAPWFFPRIFNFIKPFFGQKTFGKIFVFGKPTEDTRVFLTTYFSDEVVATILNLSNEEVCPSRNKLSIKR